MVSAAPPTTPTGGRERGGRGGDCQTPLNLNRSLRPSLTKHQENTLCCTSGPTKSCNNRKHMWIGWYRDPGRQPKAEPGSRARSQVRPLPRTHWPTDTSSSAYGVKGQETRDGLSKKASSSPERVIGRRWEGPCGCVNIYLCVCVCPNGQCVGQLSFHSFPFSCLCNRYTFLFVDFSHNSLHTILFLSPSVLDSCLRNGFRLVIKV